MKVVLMLIILQFADQKIATEKYEYLENCISIQAAVERQVRYGRLKAGAVTCKILPETSFKI